MKKQQYRYTVSELEDEPRLISEELSSEFLTELLADTDATPVAGQTARLEVSLSKNGDEVLVQGNLRLKVAVPCARTLDPAEYDLRPAVLLILSPSPDTEAPPRRPRRQKAAPVAKVKPAKNKSNWQNDPALLEEEAASDCYFGDELILDSFLREFILLELPMVPLREDLRDGSMEATRALPENLLIPGSGENGAESSSDEGEKPIDPRLSPLLEIKARLANKE